MEKEILENLKEMQKDIKSLKADVGSLKEGQVRIEKKLDKIAEQMNYGKKDNYVYSSRKDNYLFPSIFEIDEYGRIGVTFPDLPGAITCGDNLDEAIKNAEGCMGLHLFGMEMDNEVIPSSTLISEIKLKENETLMPIDVYMPPVREAIMREREKRKKQKEY